MFHKEQPCGRLLRYWRPQTPESIKLYNIKSVARPSSRAEQTVSPSERTNISRRPSFAHAAYSITYVLLSRGVTDVAPPPPNNYGNILT